MLCRTLEDQCKTNKNNIYLIIYYIKYINSNIYIYIYIYIYIIYIEYIIYEVVCLYSMMQSRVH